jgi:hypothetical protein
MCQEEEIERDRTKLKRIRMVIVNIQSEMVEIVAIYNENVNNDSVGLKFILTKGEEWMEVNKITTEELQRTLKVAKNKISTQDFNAKLGTLDYKKENIMKFRDQCKNVKLRHIYYRLISRDFFTMEKMFKYKMVINNRCKRCEEIETYKHLIWDFREARKIWHLFNEFLIIINQHEEKVLVYENIFKIGNFADINKLKMRVIQGMIQIERPINWTNKKIMKIANEIKYIEKYNTTKTLNNRKKGDDNNLTKLKSHRKMLRLLIGSSNVYRTYEHEKFKGYPSYKMIKCTRIKVFEAAMEKIKDEKEVIIAVIENFICDAVRDTQEPTPDLIDDAIDKILKNFMGVIHGTATRLPKTRFALALPIMRPRHDWYMERYEGLCRTFAAKINALGLENVSKMEALSKKSQSFLDDQVHFSPESSKTYVNELLYYADNLFTAEIVNLEEGTRKQISKKGFVWSLYFQGNWQLKRKKSA